EYRDDEKDVRKSGSRHCLWSCLF
ncbi:hypothetical protein Tco_1534300, partial [Tanacetum coccineum]